MSRTELLSYREHAALEVEWYRVNGRYPAQRIARDSDGVFYVIGDQSWNADKRHPHEEIERKMSFAISDYRP